MSDGTSGDGSEDELATLFPEHELEIQGETITVRPISFLEGVRLSSMIQPLVDDISTLCEGEKEPEINELMIVFVEHEAVFVKLQSLCSDKDEEWIRSLPDEDGSALALTFWEVNSGFFIRKMLVSIMPEQNRLATSGGGKPLRH